MFTLHEWRVIYTRECLHAIKKMSSFPVGSLEIWNIACVPKECQDAMEVSFHPGVIQIRLECASYPRKNKS